MPVRFQANSSLLTTCMRNIIRSLKNSPMAGTLTMVPFLISGRAEAGLPEAGPETAAGMAKLWEMVVDFSGSPTAAGLLVASVLVACLLSLLLFRYWRRRKAWKHKLQAGKAKSAPAAGTTTTGAETRRSAKPLADDLPLQQQIQMFFFNLFKLQSGLGKDAPGQMYKVETLERCPENVFLMRLKQGGDWSVRRMSIGLLSSGAGSRSQCFYVIYDTHMVVKIPPQPITDFYRYNRQLAREARIAGQLAPLPCIVPKVSVILRKAHSLPYAEDSDPDELEKRYKNLVETRPEYQEYLKIGNSFVFFMELSKHFFLIRTIDDIHRDHHPAAEEIRRHGELVWDQGGFIGRYGEDAWHLGVRIVNIFNGIESKLRKWCADQGVADVCSLYQLKRWFIDFLSRYDGDGEKENGIAPKTLDAQVIEHIKELASDYHEDIVAFKAMVETYLTKRRYEMTRVWRRNLSSSILELLGSLYEKRVAMRDLKPENLFVAGDPSRYPNFLNDSKAFSMGLIDMETAVVIEANQEGKTLEQPQLGGTPLYATPSHFLPNNVLETLFKDARRTLYFQDWYAGVAIIFKIITGKSLFRNTAGLFGEILRRLRAKKNPRRKLDLVVEQSAVFWTSAAHEFETSLASYLDVFEGIVLDLPKVMITEIEPAIQNRAAKLTERIDNLLDRQAIFKHPGQKTKIKAASSAQIESIKKKLGAKIEAQPEQARMLAPAMKFLEQLRLLKFRLEQQQAAGESLAGGSREVGAAAVLEAMFYTVMNFMYPVQWRRSGLTKSADKEDAGKETTFLPTV